MFHSRSDTVGADSLVVVSTRGALRHQCDTNRPGVELFTEIEVHGAGAGLDRMLLRVTSRDGVVGQVTSDGYGYPVGDSIGYAYLPVPAVQVGTPVAATAMASPSSTVWLFERA